MTATNSRPWSTITLATLLAVTLVFLALAFTFGWFDRRDAPDGTLNLTVTVPSALVRPSAPRCADVFVPGKVIDIKGADFACADPDGTLHFVGGFRCNDGRHLWSMERAAGPPPGYGFSGEPYQQIGSNDIAGDPGYGKAYEICHN